MENPIHKDFKVYIMFGIPWSGKTTYIKENLKWLPIISRDIIRAQLWFTKDGEKKQCSFREERQVTEVQYKEIVKLAKNKISFIIDDTHTNKRYRKKLIQLLKNYGPYIIWIELDTPLETCIKRRKWQIPANIIAQIKDWIDPLEADECNEIIHVQYNPNTKN